MNIDQRAMDLVIARSETRDMVNGGSVARRLFLQKMAKAHKRASRRGIVDQAVQVVKKDPNFAWQLCNARMMLGHYEDYEGWEYRDDWSIRLWKEQPLGPPWDGSYTKKLYLLGEQGVGDEVLFSQCIPDAIKSLGHRNIVLDTEPRLIPVFERSFGITCVPRLKISDHRPGMTSWMCIGDLLRLYRTGKTWSGPYLKADPKRIRDFAWVKGKQAVSWKGLKGGYEVGEFVAKVGTGIDVQYNDSSDLLEQPGIDKREDIEGLLGIFSNVSRLASVSTSVVHLAAALGTKVDLILASPFSGKKYDQLQWRWGLDQDTTPWYPSVRIHRKLNQFAKSEVRSGAVRDRQHCSGDNL